MHEQWVGWELVVVLATQTMGRQQALRQQPFLQQMHLLHGCDQWVFSRCCAVCSYSVCQSGPCICHACCCCHMCAACSDATCSPVTSPFDINAKNRMLSFSRRLRSVC